MAQTRSGYDLAVIGSGGGAFAAAIAARGKGKSVVMVERGTVGGTCVNTGCVPSKALLAAAEARRGAQDAPRFPGIRTEAGTVDFPALIGGKDALVRSMRTDKYVDLAADYGWDIITGTARFTGGDDAPALHVDLADGGTRRIEAAHYLIATGSTPWAPPIEGLHETGYLTSTTAMDLDHLPATMLVIGGGYVALEQAQLFVRLGTEVTMAVRTRLASHEEPEVCAAIESVLTDGGITVHTHARIVAVHRDGDRIRATLHATDGRERDLHADQLLVATGRRPVTEHLGLPAVGVKTGEHGQVVVDEYLRTTNPRIWAAGDVTGHPQYVYVAAAHGTLVADNAFDNAERTMDYRHLPKVTFTSPAIATVGLTEEQVVEAGLPCDCRVLPLAYVPRALANRDTRGLVKLIANADTGQLLGAHVIAEGAGEIITAATYALTAAMTIDQIAHTWHPYLTMGEALKLAAQTFTTDVTKLSCCAG